MKDIKVKKIFQRLDDLLWSIATACTCSILITMPVTMVFKDDIRFSLFIALIAIFLLLVIVAIAFSTTKIIPYLSEYDNSKEEK